MRPVLAAFLLLAPAFAENAPSPRPPITLVFQFEGEYSEAAVEGMKREVDAITRAAGMTFEYRLPSELNESEPVADLIMVKFRGHCGMPTLPPLLDERGPFATTHVADGVILPYSEVACDRVRVSIRSVMDGRHLKRADILLGRALGRVVAHEIYHIITRSKHHGTTGVAKPSLTASELIADELGFNPADLAKLRR